ncbi:hypothetical protein [Nocardia australiensis]|uniref:hypothetical protein n=1 Tax=Nocardia australiensis TaxID=2887191 RepID=UPI001D15A842|nr:hypothetical protein [Nocardia australiensis]
MRRTKSTLLVFVVLLLGSWGVASAEPAPDAPPQAPPAVALLTLTTLPNGWQGRVDLRPMLEVYADGRAVKTPDATAERAPGVATERLNGTLALDVLNTSLAEIRALSAVDLGTPTATDQGTQIIDVMPAPPEQDVHVIVYAPELTEGLSAEQQDARKRFADLYRKLLDAFVQDH